MLFERRRGIIRNAEVFNQEYVPDSLPGREKEVKEIAGVLAYLEDAGISGNVFIVGPPGTGKTAVTKYVLREFTKYSIGSFTVYVNCWVYRTRFAIMSKFAEGLGIPVPRRGIAPDEAYSRIFEKINRYKNAVIVLDEMDKLSSQDVLYDISRMAEFVDVPVSVITIANREAFLSKTDPRIVSTLFRRKIYFAPYGVPQLKDIVRERAELALFPGTYTENVISLCAVAGWKRGGDARVAISCLLEAARIAEEEGERKVTEKHVKEVEKSVKIETVPADPKHAILIEILREKGSMRVKDLWKEYIKRVGNVTLRAFRNYIKDLQNAGVINVKRAPVRGNVRIIELV